MQLQFCFFLETTGEIHTEQCWPPRLPGVAPGVYPLRLHHTQIRLPTLAFKPRGDITRSPKTGVSVAHEKGLMSSKNCKKRKILCIYAQLPKHLTEQEYCVITCVCVYVICLDLCHVIFVVYKVSSPENIFQTKSFNSNFTC